MCNADLFDLIVVLVAAGGALAVMLALFGYPRARREQRSRVQGRAVQRKAA